MAATSIRGQKRLAWSLAGIAAGMFAFGFALVPLYETLCQALGINGKVTPSVAAPQSVSPTNREVRVQFLVNQGTGPGWSVESPVDDLVMRPEQTRALEFIAHNTSDRAITVRAVAQHRSIDSCEPKVWDLKTLCSPVDIVSSNPQRLRGQEEMHFRQ